MRFFGKTERRLSLALLLVAALPLITSIFVARDLVARATSLFLNRDVEIELERSLEVYNELARTMKEAIRAKADAIAAHEPLRAAAILGVRASIEHELQYAFRLYPDLVSLRITKENGELLGFVDRGRPLDEGTERKLEVQRPLAEREQGPVLVATFAAPRSKLDHITKAAEFVQLYKEIDRQKSAWERLYLFYFVVLVGVTIGFAVLLGFLLARNVTKRLGQLALATKAVGAGDLSVRVPAQGNDEITELAQAFNHMLSEVEESRARIEFLRRMSSWQEMAKRLAHEIKNPLTPIQLAIEECHKRYSGNDTQYQALLNTTVEIVSEEISTLRRLVTEFSNFARLPRPILVAGDLNLFLHEQRIQLVLMQEGHQTDDLHVGIPKTIQILWLLHDTPLWIAMDNQLLRRAFYNILSNAIDSILQKQEKFGKISICTSSDDKNVLLDIDDNGEGVPLALRNQIFDPYITFKKNGNGLGLSIVKKIVVEHGGSIECLDGSEGGARFRLRFPKIGSSESIAARLEADTPHPPHEETSNSF